MLLLDTYNGRPAEAESYRQVTGVTAPVLRQAANGTDYAGSRLEDVVVVDQDRVVRLWISASGVVDRYKEINQMVDALINKTPVINLSVLKLYFGTKLDVGQSKTVSLDVSNTGAGPLDITGYDAPIEIKMEPDKFTVATGETKTVQIILTPTKSGTFSGNITLKHNDTSVGPLQIPILQLAIEGRQLPSIGITQQSLDLGNPEVGQSVTKTLTISNAGPGTLTISDIQSDLSGVSIATKQFTVSANESKDITITVTPTTEGALSGNITVLSDDPTKSSIVLPISGTAIFVPADPRADFDKSGSIDFPDFLSFVKAFGSTDAAFDLDGSNRVDFADFLIFAKSFGKTI